jgi:hypothetical protein
VAIILLKDKPTKEQIAHISEEFEEYIKVVVDIKRKIVAAGGILHADCEKLLLEEGSRQKNLWGGGIDLITKKIDATAITNIRPVQGNDSMEILNPEVRKKFFEIVKSYFKGYGE